MKKCLAFVLAATFALFLFPRISAAEVSFKYELNYDRLYYYHTWNELSVTVQNPNGPDWQGTIEVESGSRYVKDIFVAEGATVTAFFYLPPRNVAHSFFQDYDNGLKIHLKDKQQRTVKSSSLNFNDTTDMNFLVGVLSSEPDRFIRLTNLATKTSGSSSKVIPLKSHHFDHYLNMDNFALIIVSDTETLQLTAPQQENLARWVSGGGLLVVGGGRGWTKNKAALPSSLLPFTPSGTVEADTLTLLTDRIKLADAAGGRLLLTAGEVVSPRGEIMLEAAQGPLLIAGDYGKGRVIYSTLNLEDPPFNNTLNFENIWNYIFGLNTKYLVRTSERHELFGFSQFLSSLALGNADPLFLSPLKLFTGLLFYILLAGPISFFILKRRQKWEYAWFTIPALAIVFTGAIYAAGSSGRQSELTHYQINIYDIYQGDQASLESYSGLFIPRRGSLSLGTAFPALAGNKGVTLAPGSVAGETEIDLSNPPLWSLQRFYARDMTVLDGPIELSAAADRSGGTITVTNNSGVDMFDSYARLGDEWFKTGPLAAGQSKTVSSGRADHFDISHILEHYQGGNRRGGMPYPGYSLEELFPGRLLWIGFNDTLQPFRLGENIKIVPLNIFQANCELPELKLASEFDLPEGWLVPRPAGFSDGDQYLDTGGYKDGYGYQRHFYGQGWLDLEYDFPPGIDYGKGSYKLNFSQAEGKGYLEVQAFHNGRQEWQKVGELRVGDTFNGEFILPDPEQFIAGDRLLIRIDYDGEVWFWIDRILSVQGGGLK